MMMRVKACAWRRTAAVLALTALLAGGCTALPQPSADPPADDGEAIADTDGATSTGIAYRVAFAGISDDDLLATLRASSVLLALEARPPPSPAALDSRIANDRERLDTVLRSEGYYQARIAAAIDEGQTPPLVTITITPGEPYRLTAYLISFVGDAPPPPTVPLAADLGITYGEVARAKTVVEAQARLLRELADTYRPLARIADREIVVDHDTRTMRVRVDVDAGPPTRFGATMFAGLDRTDEDYVRALVPWQQGEAFRQDQVEKARRRLLRTGLFDAVETRQGDAVDEVGELPMTIRVVEGKSRSISAGAKYSTSEGPGGDVVWEHRNLFGSNETLAVKAEGNRFTQEVSALLTRPNWRRPDRALLLGVTGTRTDSTAYDERGGEVSAQVRSPLVGPWVGTVGTSLEASRIKDKGDSSTLVLAGLPASLARDDTTERFDPRSGTRLGWQATPYIGHFNENVTFLENVVTASGYLPLDARERFVLAGKLKVGSIVGEDRENIPANKRFYSGGGGSVRGYQFQKIGPLDDNNDPIGGRSLLEGSAEMRTRVWGNLGVVGFVDGGTVYSSVVPSLDETMRFAAGPGLRYTTPIGPVRFDVAFPLNGRSDIDDPYEFYISLGQAF